VGQDGKGCSVQFGKTLSEVLVGELICVRGALEVRFVLCQGVVLALGTRLLVLQCFTAALVALIVDLGEVLAWATGDGRRGIVGCA